MSQRMSLGRARKQNAARISRPERDLEEEVDAARVAGLVAADRGEHDERQRVGDHRGTDGDGHRALVGQARTGGRSDT